MTKRIVKNCEKCGSQLKYSRHLKQWYCPACLYGAYLTHQAQAKASKKWRQSPQGKARIRDWEHTEKGKAARERYLKSDKYKQRRKEYNERLKESMKIAHAAHEALRKEEPGLTQAKMSALVRDIRDFASWGRRPTLEEVADMATKEYNLTISLSEASKLRDTALQQ